MPGVELISPGVDDDLPVKRIGIGRNENLKRIPSKYLILLLQHKSRIGILHRKKEILFRISGVPSGLRMNRRQNIFSRQKIPFHRQKRFQKRICIFRIHRDGIGNAWQYNLQNGGLPGHAPANFIPQQQQRMLCLSDGTSIGLNTVTHPKDIVWREIRRRIRKISRGGVLRN